MGLGKSAVETMRQAALFGLIGAVFEVLATQSVLDSFSPATCIRIQGVRRDLALIGADCIDLCHWIVSLYQPRS